MSQVEHTTPKRERKHLNYEERKIIERLYREGVNKNEISKLLLRDKSTIKREIKRGSVIQRKSTPKTAKNPQNAYIEKTIYFADVGQRVYDKHRLNCGNKNKIALCPDLVSFVEEKILGPEKWSPDAAIGYAKTNNITPGQSFSTKTFYNWVDDCLLNVRNIDLLHKVRRKPHNKRKARKRVLGKSIDERPAAVETREEFGHWEGDGIVGKNRRGQLITLVERKTGVGLMFNVGNREESRIVEVIDSLAQRFGSGFSAIFKSITFDNGSEFADSASIERDGRTKAYYAHPYSSFERGTNENWNGIVRRFIPKGRSFDDLTDNIIRRINHYINTLPRKRFGYKTPLDKWFECMDEVLMI